MRGAACAFALLVVLSGRLAVADTPPDVWDSVRDPTARERYALHLTVREAIAIDRQSSPTLRHHHPSLDRARTLLEEAHADTSPDPVLRFDLGDVYFALRHFDRAIDAMNGALALAPSHPSATDALLTLANAYAQLDRSADERDVYERYLARTTSERSRAIALLNLAEAHMHLGDLTAAIAGYKDAIQAASALPNLIELEDNTGTLAVWGLAVALDRAGDVAGGAAQVRLAVQLDPGDRILTGPNVFFVPEYEGLWYRALGKMERAKQASTPQDAVVFWSQAESLWSEYLKSAKKTDRWLALAKARYERAHAQRLAAEKRWGIKVDPKHPAPPIF